MSFGWLCHYLTLVVLWAAFTLTTLQRVVVGLYKYFTVWWLNWQSIIHTLTSTTPSLDLTVSPAPSSAAAASWKLNNSAAPRGDGMSAVASCSSRSWAIWRISSSALGGRDSWIWCCWAAMVNASKMRSQISITFTRAKLIYVPTECPYITCSA